MTTTIDGKTIVNSLHHSAVITFFTVGLARLGWASLGGPPPNLVLTSRDVSLLVVDVTFAMVIKDILIKQGYIPADIMK